MEDVPRLVRSIAPRFCIPGEFEAARRYGSGHINDTFLAAYRCGNGKAYYIHQRINERVFADIPGLMANVGRVTRHLEGKLREQGIDDVSRRTLTLIPTTDGLDVLRDDAGRYWRTYPFIAQSHSYEVIESPAQAYEAAKAFGTFSRLLSDLPAPPLNETIPGFHDTAKRFAALLDAVEADTHKRTVEAKPEIAFVLRHERLADALPRACAAHTISNRVTHNDTKLSNVMLDDMTGEGLCVIDLDTVMPGLSLYDFGDLARTATMPVLEDERDLSKTEVHMDNFDAIVGGFIAGTGGLLHRYERENLLTAAIVITFESGLRFLTDFLQGDMYFRVRRYAQNLDRARTQFALVRSFNHNADHLRHCIERRVGPVEEYS